MRDRFFWIKTTADRQVLSNNFNSRLWWARTVVSLWQTLTLHTTHTPHWHTGRHAAKTTFARWSSLPSPKNPSSGQFSQSRSRFRLCFEQKKSAWLTHRVSIYDRISELRSTHVRIRLKWNTKNLKGWCNVYKLCYFRPNSNFRTEPKNSC